MADDNDIKNKLRSRLQDVNTLPSRLASGVESIFERSQVKTKAQLDLEAGLERTRQQRAQVNSLASSTYDADERESLRRRQVALVRREARANERIETEEFNRTSAARREAFQKTSSMLSSERLERETGRIGRAPEARFLAGQYAQGMAQSELENRRFQNLKHQEETAAQITGLSANIDDPRSAARMRYLTGKLSRQQIYGGQISAALSLQREMGIDDISVRRQSASISERINKETMREGISSDIQSGQTRSFKEELDTYRKLRDVVKETAEKISSLGEVSADLRQTQQDQVRELEKQGEKVRQMKAAGMGGDGGGLSTIEKIQLGAAGFKAAAGIAGYAAVGSEIEQMRARAGIAAVMNQQFFDQKAALSGDMSALLMTSGGINAAVLSEAENFRISARLAAGADIAGSAVGTVADVVGNARTGNAGAAVSSAISGVSDAAKGTIALSKGITQTNAALEAYSARRQLSQEEIRIRSQSMQDFYNDRVSAYRASIGAGGLSSSLMDEMTNAQFAAGIGHIDLNRQKSLFSMGMGAGGRAFRSGAQERAATIKAAAEFERTGIGTAEQYMSGLDRMVSAGGSRKDLEDIMRNAIAAGVGDAENINKMVESTANLAELINQGRGIGGAATAAQALTLGLQSYQGTSLEEEQKRQGVAYGLQNLQSLTGGSGLNLETVSQIAYLNKAIPGLKGMGLQNVVKLGATGAADVLSLIRSNKDTKTKARLLEERGLSSAFINESGDIRPDAEDTAFKIFQSEIAGVAGGAGAVISAPASTAIYKLLNAKDFNQFKNMYRKMPGEAKDYLTGAGVNRAAMEGVFGVGFGATGPIGESPTPSGNFAQAQEILSKSTQMSIKNMEAFGNSLQEINERMKKVLSEFNPEQSFSKTQQAKEAMHLDVKEFNNSVIDFKTAVSVFAKTVGSKGTEQPDSDNPANWR